MSVRKVFELELLREMILDYAIHDKNKVLNSNVRSCRLVNKTWLRSTSRILLTSREPLFHLSLHAENSSATNPYVQKNGKLLDQFVESATGPLRLDERIASHSIKAEWVSLEERENLKSLFDCFVFCGSGLIALDLTVWENQHPLLLNSNIPLPKLRKFRLRILSNAVMDYQNTDNKSIDYKNIDKKIGFVQSVFASCKKLESFEFSSSLLRDKHVADSWKNFIFPPTLTELILNCVLNNSKLRVLVNSHLPKLRKLRFLVKRTPFKNELISRILQNVRKTLQMLSVSETYVPSRTQAATTFKLPLMEKLERLEIDHVYFELEGAPSSLQKLIPLLKHKTLLQQKVSMFKKWAENSCFTNVNSLKVELVQDFHGGGYISVGYRANFDCFSLEILRNAYPNLQQLEITFRFDGTNELVELPGLLFIMKEMTRLKRLCIHFYFDTEIRGANANAWDRFMIGVPAQQDELMTRLRNFPDEWDDSRFSGTPSIRNLTDLQKLELHAYDYRRDRPPKEYHPSLISDAVFQLAFLKMPNLTNIALRAPFYATKRMVDVWRNEGRSILLNNVLRSS